MKSQFTLLLNILIWVALTVGKCPDDCKELNFLYESFGCIPNCVGNDDCPGSYDCSIIHQYNDTCFYNGKHYKQEESVKNELTWEKCMGGCKCTDLRDNNELEFVCYAGSCRLTVELDNDCINKPILGECCSTTRICPPFSKCTLEGETFQESDGKFHHPKDNCTKCTCDRGEGTEGSITCQKQYCGDLLRFQHEIRRMCAPYYYNQYDCCPSQWICPEDNVTFDETAQGGDGPSCLFGDKILKKNQKLYSDHRIGKVVCQCVLPPFATCSLVDHD